MAKCIECGNTFQIDMPKTTDVVTCPICEAAYKTVAKDGKIKLTEYIYETEDFGEL